MWYWAVFSIQKKKHILKIKEDTEGLLIYSFLTAFEKLHMTYQML